MPLQRLAVADGVTMANDGQNLGSTNWDLAGNVQYADGSRCSTSAALAANGGFSNNLKITGWSPSLVLPTGARIDGYYVEVRGLSTQTSGFLDVQFTLASSYLGSLKSGSVGTTDTYVLLGGSADLWGTSFTVADLVDSTFGILVQGRNQHATLTATVRVDHARLTVYYTPAAEFGRDDNRSAFPKPLLRRN